MGDDVNAMTECRKSQSDLARKIAHPALVRRVLAGDKADFQH